MHGGPTNSPPRDHETHLGVEGNERRTSLVIAITLVVMLVEIGVGYWSGSLALTADGWHMATHAGALGLSAVAYWFARTRARSRVFTFGTGKVYVLAGFTSAILLAVAAVWMAVEAVWRLVVPRAVHFEDALPVAVVGLLVNLVSIRLLHPAQGHAHDHEHDHGHGHDHDHGHDHNLRAVYLHVVADALTSVMAIAALLCGRYLGWVSLDPLMAIVAGGLIVRWSWQLGRDAAAQLVDASGDAEALTRIRGALESLGDVVVEDLHRWQLGPRRWGCVVAVASARPRTIGELRAAVLAAAPVHHLTVELHGPRAPAADASHEH